MRLRLLAPALVLWMVMALMGGDASKAFAGEADGAARDRPGKTVLGSSSVEVPLDLTHGQPLIRAMINGKGPFVLLLDTGSSGAGLDDDVAKKLGLTGTDGDVAAGAKPTAVFTVNISSLTLGEATFSGFQATVIDFDEPDGSARYFDGWIGLAMFADCLLTLDYDNERVGLTQDSLSKADGKEILDYAEKKGLARIPVLFGDVSAEVTIASGSPGGFALAASLAKQVKTAPWAFLGRRSRAEGYLTPKPFDGSMKLGRHELFQPRVHFVDEETTVGHQVLHHFTLTLDQKNHRVRLTRAKTKPVTFGQEEPKFGCVLTRPGRNMRVKTVISGSDAERHSLKEGDVVTAVDGRYMKDWTTVELEDLLQRVDAITLTVKRGRMSLHITLRSWE